jgi:putative endonuclease
MKNKTSYNFWVYILANLNNSTFYIGVTNNLERRIYEHKNGMFEGFTKKYNLKKLVYYEHFNQINDAINREKQLKNWHRDWKINLVKSVNPEFKDLSDEWTTMSS